MANKRTNKPSTLEIAVFACAASFLIAGGTWTLLHCSTNKQGPTANPAPALSSSRMDEEK